MTKDTNIKELKDMEVKNQDSPNTSNDSSDELENVRNKVISIVKDQLDKDDNLDPTCKLTELGADSLDNVEIVMALEREFGLEIEDEQASSIDTIDEIAKFIYEAKKNNSEKKDSDSV